MFSHSRPLSHSLSLTLFRSFSLPPFLSLARPPHECGVVYALVVRNVNIARIESGIFHARTHAYTFRRSHQIDVDVVCRPCVSNPPVYLCPPSNTVSSTNKHLFFVLEHFVRHFRSGGVYSCVRVRVRMRINGWARAQVVDVNTRRPWVSIISIKRIIVTADGYMEVPSQSATSNN